LRTSGSSCSGKTLRPRRTLCTSRACCAGRAFCVCGTRRTRDPLRSLHAGRAFRASCTGRARRTLWASGAHRICCPGSIHYRPVSCAASRRNARVSNKTNVACAVICNDSSSTVRDRRHPRRSEICEGDTNRGDRRANRCTDNGDDQNRAQRRDSVFASYAIPPTLNFVSICWTELLLR
jgi:hypothetical protein